LDAQKGRQLDIKERATLITELVATGAMAVFGGRAPGGANSAGAKEILISRGKYGEAADHISDAQKAGHPDILTIERLGAPGNRKESIGGLSKVPGKQLDEYPPAMFKEGGTGASVRPISPKDNMAAGACIGNACRGLSDGEKVRIRVVD
ncbi:NucA/NucB deoxyribonuclease domain-containing protein, partial [Pseudomonas syringae]